MGGSSPDADRADDAGGPMDPPGGGRSGVILAIVGITAIAASLGVWSFEADLDPTAFRTSVRTWGRDHPLLGPFWELVTALADGKALAAVLVWIAVVWPDRARVQLLVLSQLFGGIAVQVIKWLVGRARPDSGDDSWPSGHAMSVFAFVIALMVFDRRWRAFLWPLVVAIAASRVFLERHWAGDVVAGFGVAALAVWAAARVPVFVPAALLSRAGLATLGLGWALLLLFGIALDPAGLNIDRGWACLFLMLAAAFTLRHSPVIERAMRLPGGTTDGR